MRIENKRIMKNLLRSEKYIKLMYSSVCLCGLLCISGLGIGIYLNHVEGFQMALYFGSLSLLSLVMVILISTFIKILKNIVEEYNINLD